MKTQARKREYLIFVLIIACMTFFFQGVYVILTDTTDADTFSDWAMNFPPILLMGFVVLVIIHKVNTRFKYKDNLYKRVLFELLIVTLFTVVYVFSIKYFVTKYFLIGHLMPVMPEYMKSTTMVLLGNYYFVFMLELFLYNQRQTETTKHMAVIEKERMEYLYTTLRTQVNPHFLFNSLNILSSLAYEDPQKANVYTKKLSAMYRYVLSTHAHPRVSVEEEIAFLESYIYLVQIRFGDGLHIVIHGDRKIDKDVISTSLQLLVENAIKHNVILVEQPLTIEINIKSAYIEVVNNWQLRSNSERNANGIGLSNLRKQLALYDREMEVIQTQGEFRVRIPYL